MFSESREEKLGEEATFATKVYEYNNYQLLNPQISEVQ